MGLAVCGAGVGSYVAAAIHTAPGADLARHVGWFLVSFACYLVGVVLVLAAGRTGGGRRERGMDLALILGVAVVLRLALLTIPPSLSDDVYRYAWDGKLINAGLDPHLYAPIAQELAHLRGPLWEGINHKSMASPYPPLAELLFAAAYRVAPDSLLAMQIMAVSFDLAVAGVLVLMLARWGLDIRRVLVYAWNPLVLVQFAHSAHFDAAMVLPLLGAIYLLSSGRRWASGALLGLAILVKLVPGLLVPLFLPLWRVAGLVAMGVVGVVGLLPWLVSGSAAGGLLTEATDARFNDSLNYLLARLLAHVVPNPEIASRSVAGGVSVVASLVLALLLLWRRAGWKELLEGCYWLLGLLLLLNPVVEPWYLTWMLPFLCFTLRTGHRGFPSLDPAVGWLMLSGLVVLTDLTYIPGSDPRLWIWIRLAEYGPLYLLLAISFVRPGARYLPRRGGSLGLDQGA